MKRLFTILLIITTTLSFGQQKYVDSLINQYEKSDIDTTEIDLLYLIANYYRDNKPEKTVEYSMKGVSLAKKIGDTKREAANYLMLGMGHQQIGDITLAITYFNKSFDIASRDNDKKAFARVKLGLGSCYTDIKNFSLAVKYMKESLVYFINTKDWPRVINCEVDISDALYKSGNPDEALYHLELVKGISLRENNYFLDYVYVNMAESYYLKKQFDSARICNQKAMEISVKINNQYVLSAEYLVYAKISLEEKELKDAEIYAKKGLGIANETGIRENQIDAYRILSGILEKQNDYAGALKYKSLYVTTNDSIQAAINTDVVQTFENERRDEALAKMKSETGQKDLELKEQRLTIGVILFALLGLLGLTFYVYHSRRNLRKANLKVEKANEELINSNDQIRKQSEYIGELSNLKDRLFAIIAHDLRSPLKNLKGILSLLVAERLSQEKFQTIIPALVKGVSNTSDLVENLLSWSKSQLKGATIVPENFDLYYLVEKQINLFEKQATDKKINPSNKILLNTVVFADVNMIELVLRNLVANAIKFCYPEGVVLLSAKSYEGFIEISVTDTGVGIVEENIHKVFQTKERYTTLGTNQEIGTGLGLLLCKDFVEKNNGIIGVESTAGEGTRFWFTLPIMPK